MKKTILIAGLVVAALGSLSSCSKIEDKLASGKNGNISWDGDDMIISIAPITDSVTHLATGTFEMDIDSFINANNTTGLTLDLSKIDSFKVTSCTLTILNPTSADNFKDFELSALYFNTSINTTTATIGEIDNNPDVYASDLMLPTDPTLNLRSYVGDGKVYFNYVLGVKARRNTSTTLQVKVHVTYDYHWKF